MYCVLWYVELRFWRLAPSLGYRNLPSAKLHGLILQMTVICLLPTMRTSCLKTHINHLMPNDPYRGHIALLTSKRCILYVYSTNVGTEYLKNGTYSPFFFSVSFQNAVCFIILT